VSRRRRAGDSLRKGVYVLPNLITSGSLFAGFYSIVQSHFGRYETAAFAIIAGVVLDGLDGRVARMTHTTTKFGVEYDSLADLVTFGVAPAFLVYGWALSPFDRWGWLAAFLYLVCGALRLARFNVQVNTVEKGKFNGLPIPAAATFVSSCILFITYLQHIETDAGVGTRSDILSWLSGVSAGMDDYRPFVVLVTIYVLALLMVSTVKFNSFKDLDPFLKRPFNTLVVFIFGTLLLFSEPQIMIFFAIAGYVISGPIGEILGRLRRGGKKKPEESEKGTDDGHDAD
jgi:CDP-diacylglycerol--serine O-phosphatidyltransferase